MSVKFLLSSCFVEISELNANSADPDQTPRNAASALGLHCLSMSFYRTLGLNGLCRSCVLKLENKHEKRELSFLLNSVIIKAKLK